VIVRGKAGAQVEFGNSLFLAEQCDGYIVDHELSGRHLMETASGLGSASTSLPRRAIQRS